MPGSVRFARLEINAPAVHGTSGRITVNHLMTADRKALPGLDFDSVVFPLNRH